MTVKLRTAAQRAAGRKWTRRWRVRLAVEERGYLEPGSKAVRMMTLAKRIARLRKMAARIAQDAPPAPG